MMKYLIEIDGEFWGYDTPMIAQSDIGQAERQGSKVGRILQKQGGLALLYRDIEREDIK